LVPPLCKTNDGLEVIPSCCVYECAPILVVCYLGRRLRDMRPSLACMGVVMAHAELSEIGDEFVRRASGDGGVV